VIRNRIDEQWLYLALQHERVLEYCRDVWEKGLLNVSPATRVQGRMDAESFIATLSRMLRLAELVRRSDLPHATLRQSIRLFASQVKTVVDLRNPQEHIDSATINDQGGFGYGVMPDRLLVSYGDARLDTLELLEAARIFHRTVRAAIDPIAAGDPHYQPSSVDCEAIE
jgi:hypothetical protein